jgi:signal transduction histidine kinase
MPRHQSHKPLRFGLRLRFILVIIAILLAVFSLLAYLLLHNARASLTSDLDRNSTAFAQLATRPIGDAYTVYQSYGRVRVQQEVKKFTALDLAVTNVTIVNIDNKMLFSLAKSPAVSKTAAASFDASYIVGRSGAYTTIVQPYFDTNGLHQFAVSYQVSTKTLEQTIQRQFETIILLSLLGLIITISVTYWLINRVFLRPLEAVSQGSLAISHGMYSEQIIATRNDEIGDLARSVNQMATNLKGDIFKLQEVDKLKNEFIMITSHNLRTPLTIMNGNIELLKSTILPEQIVSMIDAIAVSLKRLASFSEDILTIASIEDGKTRLTTEPVSMASLLSTLRETYEEAAAPAHVGLDWNVPQTEVMLNVSRAHIRSVLRNLLDNAIKFTNPDGMVGFTASVSGSDLAFEVTDTGIGIAPEEMPKLFTKFHRGTSTLTYDYEGTGIGLYATKLIVQAHQGKVRVASTLGKGSSFTVILPGVVLPTDASKATPKSTS